jgi:hypothetical protein
LDLLAARGEELLEQASGKAEADRQPAPASHQATAEQLALAVRNLQDLRRQELITEKMVCNAALLLGTLLGERIRRDCDASWKMSPEGIPYVEAADGSSYSPIAQVYRAMS